MGVVVRRWNLMEELSQRLQPAGNESGSAAAQVIGHQQEQLM